MKVHQHLEAVVRRCSVEKCSKKFGRIHRKTPMPEFCKIFKNTFYYRTPLVVASEHLNAVLSRVVDNLDSTVIFKNSSVFLY